MNIKNILCAVDFSVLSDAAVEHASSLARQLGATLHFVHVYEAAFAAPYVDGIPLPPPPSDLDTVREQLSTIRPKCDGEIDCRHEVVVGYPASSLLAYAKAHDIDLIVMGTHGRTGARRLLMGSAAEAVVRSAQCPVLVVHDSHRAGAAA